MDYGKVTNPYNVHEVSPLSPMDDPPSKPSLKHSELSRNAITRFPPIPDLICDVIGINVTCRIPQILPQLLMLKVLTGDDAIFSVLMKRLVKMKHIRPFLIWIWNPILEKNPDYNPSGL